jgi:pentatricopeptide repeat protein
LIRAAGRDKDTDRAFQLLEKLAIYNCVLDACVGSGDLARAKALTTTMREKSVV